MFNILQSLVTGRGIYLAVEKGVEEDCWGQEYG